MANTPQVEGPLNNGVVQLHMIKRRDMDDFEYNYLFVDVKGHERIYLEKADSSQSKGKKPFNFLGYKWS
jgi:import inner membrane translocase subunit TIM21